MMKRATLVLQLALILAAGPLAHAGSNETLPPSGTPLPAPPLPPSGVYIVPDAENPTKVTIHWSAGSSDQSGFIVERSQSSSAFTQVASSGSTATETEDQGLYADRRYKYRVRAFKNLTNGITLESASSPSQPYQAPIFKAFSGRFTSDSRSKYGFGPLTGTQDRSERYLEHVLWANHQFTSDETFATTNATFTEYRHMNTGYFRRSTTQRWHGEYVALGDAHTLYELKSFSTNTVPVDRWFSQFSVEVRTNSDGSSYGQWVRVGTNGTTEVSDPIDPPYLLAFPYAEVEPSSLTPVSASYSTNYQDIGSISIENSSLSWSWIESASAGESLTGEFLNLTFANEVIEDAPALEQQTSIPIPAPWHPYHRHLASRTFYDWQGSFRFMTDFCVKDIELHPCDGSDYDYVVAKRTTGNGQGDPEMEYTLTSFRLSGSSTTIEPVDVTEDLTEEDADGMINQNADWSVKVAPNLVAYDSPWPLDEFEKVSPGLIVGKSADTAGAIVLYAMETAIDDVIYTAEWDSQNFEVSSGSKVLSSPYIVTAETPRNFSFSIHAKEQANPAASTNFRMKAEADGGTIGDDEVKVCLIAIELSSPKAAKEAARKVTNPTSFPELGRTDWGDIYEDADVPACTIYYKDVINEDFTVQPFDVDLKIGPRIQEASWSKSDGQNSGVLVGTGPNVKCQNPDKGGVYNFNVVFTGETTRTHLALPLAGAEVKDLVASDLIKSDAFATKVISTYSIIDRNNPFNGLRWFYTDGAGDYLGRPDNANSRTIWKHNQVASSGMGAIVTWFGYPTRAAKVSNFVVAYASRKIGVWSASAWFAQILGSNNDAAASESWDAGWAVGGGASYASTASAMASDIWNKSDDKNQKRWPNPELLDNHVTRAAFSDVDREFSSPGFLEMTPP